MRPILIGLALLSLFGAAIAQEQDALAKFDKRATRVRAAIADSHVRLGKSCIKRGMYDYAREQLSLALERVPGHEKAMKARGFKRKDKRWVQDLKRVLPAADRDSVTPEHRKDYRASRDALNEASAAELVKLAAYAGRLDLPKMATMTCAVAVRYDPLNVKALKGAGWKKNPQGDWISPQEQAEKAATLAALKGAPEPREMTKLPAWARKLGPAEGEGRIRGVTAGGVTVIGSGLLHEEAHKYAHAARVLSQSLLSSRKGDLTIVLLQEAKAHKAYVKARYPDLPGLADGDYCIMEDEIEIKRGDDQLADLERVVYCVALNELRRRIGDTEQGWIEQGFATTMTRRLMHRVQSAEHRGEAAGPALPGRWKRTLRMQVSAGNQPKLADVLAARDPDEGQVIYSHFFLRWLCAERAGGLVDLCDAIKGGGGGDDALKAAYDEPVEELEKAFLQWFSTG